MAHRQAKRAKALFMVAAASIGAMGLAGCASVPRRPAGQQGSFLATPASSTRPQAAVFRPDPAQRVQLPVEDEPVRPATAVAQPVAQFAQSVAQSVAQSSGLGNDRLYGHGPDYSWLRGKIDRPYSGGIKLRFRDPGEEDRWGGCVFLTGDAAVQRLQDGALVEVRGRLIPASGNRGDTIYSYPSFDVASCSITRSGR